MPHFLTQVAKDLLAYSPTLSRQAIILPSQRAAVFLKKELSQQLAIPVWSPYIGTIENFLLETLEWEKADQPSLIFDLYDCYTNVTAEPRESFAEFSQWANLLLADFNELDRYNVDAKQLFMYLSDVERIKHWDLNPESGMSEMVKNYLKLWQDLPALYQAYTSYLKNKKKVYQGLAYREMASRIDELIPGLKKQFDHYIFVGFNALNTAEEAILTSLHKEGMARFYWDVDDYYFKDKNQEAGNFLRQSKLVKRLIEKDEFYWRHTEISSNPKDIKIIEVSGRQLQAVAANASVIEMQHEGFENVAVVLADEELLPLFLNNLADEVGTLNVTMGLPLGKTPAAGFFQLLIDIALEQELQQQKGAKHPKIHNQKWDRLLGNPLFKTWSQNAELAEYLRYQIREKNRIFIDATDLMDWSEGKLNPKVAAFFHSLLHSKPSKLWRTLSQIANTINQEHQKKDSLLQSLFSFFQLFNRLGDLMDEYPVVEDLKTAAGFYRDLLSSQALDLYGEPLSGLQVMGMLETRTLDFKNLIIASLNEGILPKGRSENSLIPFDIKREFGLPTYLDKDAIFAYHFYRLIQRAENIHLIYDGQPGNFGSGEPSRFIRQLEYELEKANKKVRFSRLKPKFSVVAPDEMQEVIPKTPAIMARLRQIAEKGFSATALSDYINDPLEFYKKRVLDIKEPEEVKEQAGYDKQGTIVHEIIEHYYSDKNGDKLKPKSVLRANEACFAYSKNEIREEVKKLMLSKAKIEDSDKGKNLLITETLVGMIYNFLKKEKSELEKLEADNQVLSLLGLEAKLRSQLMLSNDVNVTVCGFIDRIDRVGNTVRLIDYKTGGVENKDITIDDFEDLRQPKDKNKSLQLLLYAWLYFNEHPEVNELETAIISLRKPSSWLMKLKLFKKSSVSRDEMPEFEKTLTSLIEEIMDETIPFSKKLLTLESDD